MEKQKFWDIPAHKGNVNCIYVDNYYILTGGEDGIARVWARKTHELIIQFPAHHNNVRNIICDINKMNLIYTCGGDRNINCYDLKLQKRAFVKTVNNGIIYSMTQKKDGNHELISCGHNCNMLLWDFYIANPVNEIYSNCKFNIIKISNSGKYFALGSDDGEIWFYDSSNLKLIGNSNGHSSSVRNLSWSPDDKQLISVGADNSICIWNFYL